MVLHPTFTTQVLEVFLTVPRVRLFAMPTDFRECHYDVQVALPKEGALPSHHLEAYYIFEAG